MLEIVIEEDGRESRTVQVSQFPCQIGRGKEVPVQLSGWRIARVHAELHRVGRGIKLVDLGTIVGTRVNGERVVEYGPLSEKDEIELGGYRLRVQGQALRMPAPEQEMHGDVLEAGAAAGAVHGTAAANGRDDAAGHASSYRLAEAAIGQAARSSAVQVSAQAATLAEENHQDGIGRHSRGAGHARQQDGSRNDPAQEGGDTLEAVQGTPGTQDGLASGFSTEYAMQQGVAGAAGAEHTANAQATQTSRTAHASSTTPANHAESAGNVPTVSSASAIRHGATRGAAGTPGAASSAAARESSSVSGAPGIGSATASADTADAAERERLAAYARDAQEQARALGWRRLVQRQLLEVIDLRRSNLTQFSAEEVKAEVRSAVERIVAGLTNLPADIDRSMLVRDSVDEAVGLGPLERLMTDPLVSEIMVNSASEIFVERKGRLTQVPLAFSDDDAIRNVIERIVAPLGRRIDESSPLVDARLPDGSRVNAIIPPVALKGPSITIRRFNRTVMTPETLVQNASASAAMMEFLRISVQHHKSIIVSGGTGSGKTTLLNVLSNLIPLGERLITIEDAAELKLNHPHLVSLESRPPNAEGRGAITIRDLVKNALRMRPDRIIVGECRGAEALDMAQAMNTGHEGSMTTVHANTPRDVLSRLEVLMLMAGLELPVTALREQIASAVDLIIHQARFSDGSRRITSITEVCGVESGKIQSHEIFRFEQTGIGRDGKIIGRFRACDEVPSFYEALRDRGVPVDFSIFEDTAASA